MPYAGFWIRVGAYLIDAIILYIVQIVLGMMFGISAGALTGVDPAGAEALTTGAGGLYLLIVMAIGIGYYVLMESGPWQATLGKKALGLVVTDENGNRITWLRALGRYLAKILSGLILLIGYIMIAFTDKKQGLHDMLASTLVLKGQPGEHGAAGVFE
ncbi:RDD family protein [Aurantiacibacter sp. D1-12]|uniref:RDD family protein n=1 Tax=Aurantiacibacter sp. D1-12 TaxID=2993658 RepID=UPI00237CA5CB|nr:RDD family protein [Aurantiacibacter sp. D1-12]MDE1466130.1 RDD family protein [Aurantiacibacter sp. D1-12]